MTTNLSEQQVLGRAVTPLHDCLIWLGPSTNGYGRVTAGPAKGRRAHRVAWEMIHGPIPDGMTIDHLCRVRLCVNPAHMELVTREENASRGKGRRPARPLDPPARRSRRALDVGDTCGHGHLIADEADLYRSPAGYTSCRACLRAGAKRRHLGLTG